MHTDQPMHASPAVPYRQCTAKSKRSGERCRNRALIGATNCRMHNGQAQLTQTGANNPNHKHGKYVRYRTPNLRERIARLEADPDLLSQIDEIC
jgi:hypothetical protein